MQGREGWVGWYRAMQRVVWESSSFVLVTTPCPEISAGSGTRKNVILFASKISLWLCKDTEKGKTGGRGCFFSIHVGRISKKGIFVFPFSFFRPHKRGTQIKRVWGGRRTTAKIMKTRREEELEGYSVSLYTAVQSKVFRKVKTTTGTTQRGCLGLNNSTQEKN